MRARYWTCSKFADWLRGTAKLKSGTAEEWEEWEKSAKSKHKFRYWLAEEGLDRLQNTVHYVPDVFDSIMIYINNRFIEKSNALTAHPRDIAPGSWRDVGDRILLCLFNELQDFVEIELAWHYIAWNGDEARKKYESPSWTSRLFHRRRWRCPQAGLDYLEEKSKIDNTNYTTPNDPTYGDLSGYAKNALEILALYKWWTEVYRNRPDPMAASGWSDICDEARKEHGNVLSVLGKPKDKASKKRKAQALALSTKIENSYRREEQQMLIRLIKIRNSLWT
jgi:hypothetical protein